MAGRKELRNGGKKSAAKWREQTPTMTIEKSRRWTDDAWSTQRDVDYLQYNTSLERYTTPTHCRRPMPTLKMMSSALRLGLITLFGAKIRFSFVNNGPFCLVEGLVNVPPFSQHLHRARCPIRRHTFVYTSRDTTTTTADESPATLTPAEPSSMRDVAGDDIQTSMMQTTIPSTTSQTPTQSVEIASQSSQKRDKPAQRMGVWMPPSKNVDQKRGKIFSIQRPQDLLDFVIEDERLSVGESST